MTRLLNWTLSFSFYYQTECIFCNYSIYKYVSKKTRLVFCLTSIHSLLQRAISRSNYTASKLQHD